MWTQPINKALADELARLDALLARQERAVQEAFASYVAGATDERTTKEIADLLARGNVEAAIAVLDSYIRRMGTVLPTLVQQAGTAEVAALAGMFQALAPTVAIAFDVGDPYAAELARRAQYEFITRFTESQRAAVRQAMVTEMSTGAGTQATARAFRDAIGLTPGQEAAVRNYRALLEAGSMEAKDRAWRDRRSDRTVERASRSGEPIPPDRIDAMVAAYRRKALAARAETIARTEATRITSQSRREAFRQALAQTGVDPRDARKRWNTNIDGRERDTHRAMNGQTHPLDQPYHSPSGALLQYPGDPSAPADEVIECRCHETFTISRAS